MALKLFYELTEEKRDKIIETALHEFAAYGFSESSTNRIVKNAGISKGSLFKYFKNKEELYFDILDIAVNNYVMLLNQNINALPEDICERAVKLAQIEFSWYIAHPEYYNLFKNAFLSSSPVYKKSIEKYGKQVSDIFDGLFEHTGPSEGEKKLNIIKWFLVGFNQEFIDKTDMNQEVERLEADYIKELEAYIEILKKSIG